MNKAVLLLFIALVGFQAIGQPAKQVFYLHGRIIDLPGSDAVHEVFGPSRQFRCTGGQ